MRTTEQVKWDFVQQWLGKARRDVRAAGVLLAAEAEDYDTVGFHAQQGAEKFIKAALVRHQIEFPKTHDIAALRKLLGRVDPTLSERLTIADVLTPYGVEFRYPGDRPSLSKEQGAQAIQLAEQVSVAVLDHLQPYLDAGRP